MTVADLLGCSSPTNTREKMDFYASPTGCAEALLAAEGQRMPRTVWEPSCGNGALSRPLRAAGIEVFESDLVPRGTGVSRIDFLMERKAWAPAIVTNPPFKNARAFVEHARNIGIQYMALLLKADFLNSAASLMMVNKVWNPAREYALSWRPDFTGQGSPPMNCSWFVFDGFSPLTQKFVLPKPNGATVVNTFDTEC